MSNDQNQLSRRGFVQTAALAAGAAGLSSASTSTADVKFGLYSITYGGVWYRGDALTTEQVIDRAAKFGYHGVEIDGKRPHGNPLDLSKARCQELRQRAAGQGIEIYAVAANNDFSSPVPEHRESQLVYTRELMRMTADLGASEAYRSRQCGRQAIQERSPPPRGKCGTKGTGLEHNLAMPVTRHRVAS